MFWAALDDGQRRLVIYAAAYALLSGLLALQHRSRERMKAELREELGLSRGRP